MIHVLLEVTNAETEGRRCPLHELREVLTCFRAALRSSVLPRGGATGRVRGDQPRDRVARIGDRDPLSRRLAFARARAIGPRGSGRIGRAAEGALSRSNGPPRIWGDDLRGHRGDQADRGCVGSGAPRVSANRRSSQPADRSARERSDRSTRRELLPLAQSADGRSRRLGQRGRERMGLRALCRAEHTAELRRVWSTRW